MLWEPLQSEGGREGPGHPCPSLSVFSKQLPRKKSAVERGGRVGRGCPLPPTYTREYPRHFYLGSKKTLGAPPPSSKDVTRRGVGRCGCGSGGGLRDDRLRDDPAVGSPDGESGAGPLGGNMESARHGDGRRGLWAMREGPPNPNPTPEKTLPPKTSVNNREHSHYYEQARLLLVTPGGGGGSGRHPPRVWVWGSRRIHSLPLLRATHP